MTRDLLRAKARAWGARLLSIAKYAIASFLCTGVDFLVFYLLSALLFRGESLLEIGCATVLARVASAAANFLLNRRFVFRSRAAGSALRYAILSLCTIAVSAAAVYGGVHLFHWLGGGSFQPEAVKTALKAVVDTLLFFANYHLCKKWVFQTPGAQKEP